MIGTHYFPDDLDGYRSDSGINITATKLIELPFLPFSEGRHPEWLLLSVIALGNILFWIAFTLAHYQHWGIRDFAVIWIIPLGVHMTIGSWDKFLWQRAWSRACRSAYLILENEVEFWLMQQWTLLDLFREGNLAPNANGTVGEALSEAIEDRLTSVNFWLRNKIIDEFARIEIVTPLGTGERLDNKKRNRIIGEIQYYFNEKLHGENRGRFWWRLLVNILVLLAVWIFTDLNH